MNLNELPAWSDIESQPWFAELTPEEKQQSLTKWQGDMMSFAKDPKEKFAVAATSKAKARSFFGEEMPDDPIADALQRRQKDLEDIGSRYDAFSKGELEEDDEEVLTLNDTLKGNTPYSVIKGRLFVSPQLVWDKAAYEKVVNEAPVDEDERVLAMSAYDGSKERAAEGVVNSLGYTDEAFRDFAAKGFKEGKSNAAILDEWKSNNKLPDGILGSLRGVGRQAYFGLRSGLSGLERAMGGLGGFFGSESAQKYAEESGKEAQSYMQRTLGEGPEFIGELTSGAVSIIPTIAAGAAASVISEGAALPAAASITAGAIQSAGATQAETYEFYRNQGLDHANALAESRVDGLVSGLITGAITHYAGKLGDKIGLGKGIEGLFSGPASKIASKLTQREISESLKAGAKAVGGSFLQEGSEELLDQAAQDAYSMIKRDPTLTLAEAINNALQAGKVGAVLGGAAEAGKIGLNSLLNSAKFSVPTTEEEEALRAKFEVPAAVEEEVIASPEVQQEEQNIKTAADVVKEAAPVAPQTAAVLADITEEKAGELAADVVGATEEVLADIEAEAPLVSPETTISPKPPVSPASETAPISETQAPAAASMPMMVTREMNQQLADLGYSRKERNALRPEQAAAIIAAGVRKEKPVSSQLPQGKPVETPTNAQPEKVATTRSEKEVGQDQQKFLSDLQFYGTARLGDNTFAIKQASDDSFYIEKTTGGQRSTVASGFLDIEAAQRGAAELVAPTPEEVASTGQPPTPVEEALPERGASVETIASGGGMSVEEARQFLARRSDSGEPLIFGRPFSEISGMQQNERPRVLQASDKLRAVKQVVGDINKFRIPVSQDVVNAYGITLPSGYVKQGDLYVFQTPSPPTTGAVPTKTLPAGQKVTPGGVASPAVEAAPEPAPEAQPEQPDAKEKAPTEPSESTLSIAKRFGGRIAWSQGDLAIIEGFQLFGSKSLYVAVVGDRYSLTDFTLMKPEQRKALLGDNEELFLRKREELVEANNRMLAQNPDGPFTNGQTVVVSKNVPQSVASVFREWVRLLGLSAPTRIVLTTPRDGIDMAAEYGGKFRRIGVTSLMSDNERGQMTPLGEDDFHIFYKEDTSYARTLEVLAHELGHILERQSFKNLPDDQRKAIIAEHEKWLKRVGSQKALDGIRELRAMRVGRIQPNVDRADDRFDSLNAYWKSFSEWFADQVARWATTTDKPLTVIEKFFARLGKKLREFFNLKGSQFAPNQRIADWLNSLSPDLNAVVEETLAPAEPAPEAQPEQPVSQPVQSFRDAVSQMTATAQAKWTPELRATAEAYLDSGGTTGLQGLSDVQQKVVGRFLPEEVKAAFDAEDARKRAQRNKLPDHRESSLPPTPGKQIRKIGKGAMESVPVVLDEIAKVIPNIRDLVEVRESVEGEPDAEGFYDPQADKAVVLVDNVYLKPQHGGSQEAALRETIVHELLHRGFAKLRQTNPQLFEQFEAFSITDTNDNLLDSLVRRGYTMYSNWRNDPAQAQKAREEVFVRKAALDLAVNGLDAIKSPTSLASQFFKWFKEFLSKLLGRTPPENQLIHWTQIFLNAAQADFIEKTPGERMHAFAGEKAIENLPEERRQFMRDSLETAKAMAAAGKDGEEIRAVTGWFPGKYDGKMRWELPDAGAALHEEKVVEVPPPETQRGYFRGGVFYPDVNGDLYAVVTDGEADIMNAGSSKQEAEDRWYEAYAPNKKRKVGGTNSGKLFEVLDHPALFDAYPTLKEIEVEFRLLSDRLGDWTVEKNLIRINSGISKDRALSTLLHEAQHAIQSIEGFAKGSSVSQFSDYTGEAQKRFDRFRDILDSLGDAVALKYNLRNGAANLGDAKEQFRKEFGREPHPEAGQHAKFLTDEEIGREAESAQERLEQAARTIRRGDAFKQYQLTAGEIEARDVQARQNFTPEQRKATAPYSSENIAKEDAIVMFGGGGDQRMFSLGRDLLSPEKYARHAELEAKHNAGTITPEETAEAQALVEEAAKAAGLSDLLFHGTDSEFTEFDPAMAGSRTRGPKAKLAFWFTESERHALERGSIAMPVFLQYSNPLVVERLTDTFDAGDIIETAKAKGHDAVIFERLDDLENSSIGVYSVALIINESVSSQIKSAERFTGVLLEQRFGPSPDIRYSLGEPPDMQAVKDRLNTFIDENKATNSFLEAFGPVRVERMQQQGEKLGPEYIQAQVRPLMQRAQAELGFELDEEGDYVLSQRATDKAQNVLVKWLQDGRKFAKAYNKKAEKFFDKLFPGMEDIPVDSDMAAAVLLHEIMSYAKALAASSPKAEDQILLDMIRPQYGSVVLANYDQTMHKSGRTLQTARNYSEGTELGQDAVENANKKGEEKVTEELGDEALPSATEEGKAGLEAGVDAAPDIPAPADPTLRLLDLAVESLDEVAKADAEAVFDVLRRLGRAQDKADAIRKAGNKAMSILTDKSWLEEPLPDTLEELDVLVGKLRVEAADKLAKLRSSLEGAKPETKKKVKAEAAKTKSKTDSIQKLIDKLSKMPDESKEAKPKAETLRSAIADAIKEKEFDEQKVRDAATKFGATPEQTERLVEEAERLHETAQDKTPSKTKLRKFLLSHPQETLYNPEQRQALVKTFLRNEVGMNDAEIARYLPKFESSFGKAMEDARKKYLDGLEKRFNAPKKARESRVDAQNRKLLQALRAGLAETKSPKVALLERLGFKEFKPTDKHVIAKLDAARTEALANGEFAKARLKQTELSSLLLRRRPPMGWMQLLNQAWITSALSSFRNLALNVWTPLGEAVSRYFGALAGALKTGDFTTVTALTKALGEAFRRVPARFKFAYSANTFTQQANAAIAEQASLIDEFRRSLSQLRDKKLSKKDRTKAATRVVFSFGDYSRRLLQSIDESWFSVLESFISSANLTSDINKYGIKAEALTEASVHFATQAKNDAYAVSQIVDRLSDYLDGLRGKTTAEIQQALELYRMDQLGISPENLAFTNEMLDVIEQLRLRSGAEGDALLKAAKRNINDYRRLAWVRAAEKADADTREWVSAVLTGKGVEKVDVDQVLKDATEGSERAASYGMGLHRVEEAPALDIGNTFAKMVEAMGQQAIRVNPMLGRMMVGFFGIPVNLMNKSLWFAPGYGALRYFAFRKMAERHPEKQFYAYSLANEKERAQRFREVIFGHAVFGLLAALGAFDDRDEEETEGLYVTLGGPANKTEKDAWLSRGFRPYSVCIKHADGSVTSIPYGVGAGEFMKMPLMAAGAFDDMRLNKKLGNREDMSSALEYFNAFAAGVGRQATFLGAKNTVGALLPDTFGAGTVANLAFAAGNFFPFNGLDRSLETLVSGPPDRSRTGAILANIPYLRHFEALGARPATNVFGDPWGSKTADPIEIIEDRLLSQSISVWNTSKPLTGRDKKLYEFIGRYQVGPNGPQRGALELRNGYLTDQEWANYRDAWAANAKREWLSSLDRMARMDEDGRAKAAAELSTRASRKAKDRFNYK